MVRYAFIAIVGLASALPLNINLGAYSPALVVGDGEISFGGEQDVSSLMNVLEGAAVNTAASVANGAGAGAVAAPAEAAKPATPAAPAAAAPAAEPSATNQVVSAAAAADPVLTEQAAQISKLQGMGKEIAPRVQVVDVHTEEVELDDVEDDVDDDVEDDASDKKAKRDLAGFDRALKYAEAALTKGPKIELGTGEGGSGVGITVDNGAAAGGAAAAKRDLSADAPAPRRRAKVTTMYVRSGIPASLQNKRTETAGQAKRAAPFSPATPAVPVGRRDAIDSLNLNVDGDQGLTMTFVEELDE